MKNARALTTLLAMVTMCVGLLVVTSPSTAAAAVDNKPRQCWYANPGTPKADRCEDRGWVIRRHVLMSPERQVSTDLPECWWKGGGRCWWAPPNHARRWFINIGTRENPWRIRHLTTIVYSDASGRPIAEALVP